MPTVSDDDDDDRDTTPKGIARRLNRVAEIIHRANTRLERIRGVLAEPPEPDKPAIVAAANQIKLQAATATKSADEIISKLR